MKNKTGTSFYVTKQRTGATPTVYFILDIKKKKHAWPKSITLSSSNEKYNAEKINLLLCPGFGSPGKK